MFGAIETGVPMFAEARALIDGLHSVFREIGDGPKPGIARACKSLVASFANRIIRSPAAV